MTTKLYMKNDYTCITKINILFLRSICPELFVSMASQDHVSCLLPHVTPIQTQAEQELPAPFSLGSLLPSVWMGGSFLPGQNSIEPDFWEALYSRPL